MNEQILDTTTIGDAAGKVWHHLEAKGPLQSQTMMRQLKLPAAVYHAALGWLAREGKLAFEGEGKQLRLGLKP
jgi:DNA-binding IclR family transcriptional regulator